MTFPLGDMGEIMKQAQAMQRRMHQMQEGLKERVVEATVGGGMVTAKANGARELVSCRIAKEVVDPEDVEMLEDLIVSACNQALRKAEELQRAEMASLTGGLQIPGLQIPGL